MYLNEREFKILAQNTTFSDFDSLNLNFGGCVKCIFCELVFPAIVAPKFCPNQKESGLET